MGSDLQARKGPVLRTKDPVSAKKGK